MPSLNLDLDFFDHPKTRRLVGLLGRGSEVLLLRLWCYCGKYHFRDGRLTGYSPQEIESICGWWGQSERAIQNLVRVGFLEAVPDGYLVHDWDHWQGHFAVYHDRARKAAEERWKGHRNAKAMLEALHKHGSSNAPAGQGSANSPTESPPTPKQAKKKKEDEKAPDIPLLLLTDEFQRTWSDWIKYRKEIGKPLKPTGMKRSLDQCEKMGVADAIEALKRAMVNGWRGFTFDDEDKNGRTNHQRNGGANGSRTVREYSDPSNFDPSLIPR
jgi:hypothetical protein